MAMGSIQFRHEILNTLWKYTDEYGYIDKKAILDIAHQLDVSAIEIEGIISFYHFFNTIPGGKHQIILNNGIVSEIYGYQKIKTAFENITGVRSGVRDKNKIFSIQETSCIGLSDEEPACLIDFYPFTNLTVSKVNRIISLLKSGVPAAKICDNPISNLYVNTGNKSGILLRDYYPGSSISKLKEVSSNFIIDKLKMTRLSGMGGAFFPAYIKWQSCKNEHSIEKYIVCNADEGEPGTFKDRCLIQRVPGLIVEGMIISAFVVGAKSGVIYLRAEYRYLKNLLEKTLSEFRKKNWLGKDILDIEGFDFDIRIQLGAGAYICGEETALLRSMEGFRGEPTAKVYFPTQKGFLGAPTLVSNVETFCAAARIIELGNEEYCKYGHQKSYGTKLLSVSGDCHLPGVYEIEWGMTIKELLDLVKAENPYIAQMSGPSGEICFKPDWQRKITLDDVACGGSVMIFNEGRNLFDVLQKFNDFFIYESCGICTPCRAGNFILKKELEQLKMGLSDFESYKNIYEWSKIMMGASRCGLGKSASRSIIQSIDKKPELFSSLIAVDNMVSNRFDMIKAIEAYDLAIQKHN